MNNRTPHDPYIQALGVDISHSPPRTCAVLASKLPSGTMMIHDEWHWDRALTVKEVEQLHLAVAATLRMPLKVAVDVVDFGNWENGK